MDPTEKTYRMSRNDFRVLGGYLTANDFHISQPEQCESYDRYFIQNSSEDLKNKYLLASVRSYHGDRDEVDIILEFNNDSVKRLDAFLKNVDLDKIRNSLKVKSD